MDVDNQTVFKATGMIGTPFNLVLTISTETWLDANHQIFIGHSINWMKICSDEHFYARDDSRYKRSSGIYNNKNIVWEVHIGQRKYSPEQKYINIQLDIPVLLSHFRINAFRKLSVVHFSVYCYHLSSCLRCRKVICQQLRAMFWMWFNKHSTVEFS